MHVRSPPPFPPSPATQSGPAIVLSARNASPEGVARAITLQQQSGEGFRIPLFRAVPTDEIAFTMLGTGQAPPLSRLDDTLRPAIIVLTDDDDSTRTGPDGWPHASRIMRWARNAMLHAAGGLPEHYDLAVSMAKVCRRLVLVEACTAQVNAWTVLALRTMTPGRILRVQPLDGGIHPIAVPSEQMQ